MQHTRVHFTKSEIDTITRLYNSGKSTKELAELYGRQENTMRQFIKYRGISRGSSGVDVERKVADWYMQNRWVNVTSMPGDAPYDLLVDGVRIDVKSANLSYDAYTGRYSYNFSIRHKNSLNKDYQKEVDKFLLVFLGGKGKPMYLLDSSEVFVKRGIKIHESLETRYPLEFLGYLEPIGGEN